MNQEQRKQRSQLQIDLNELLNCALVTAVQAAQEAYEEAKAKLEEARVALANRIAELRDDLDTLKGEEEDKHSNMPESLQNGERGERMQAAIDALQTAYDELYSAVVVLNDEQQDYDGQTLEQFVSEANEEIDEEVSA